MMRWKLTRQAMHDWIVESALNPDKTTNHIYELPSASNQDA